MQKKDNQTINFCKKCLYSSQHPLGIVIDEKGICSGCKIHDEKNTINWNKKWLELKKIIKNYKLKKQNFYDCIIPVTGANDSFFTVHVVKNLLKMNPLLVCYNKYWNTPLGIKNLSTLRIKFNCDIIFQNVNPIKVKKITKASLYKLGSIYWHSLSGHSVFPVQISIKYKIPLIIWGAHQGLEQVGMYSHHDNVEMSRRYRKNHDLMGIEAENLISSSDNLTEGDVFQYFYPDDYELNKVGTRGIYLGNFIRWDVKKQHEEMIKYYNYKTCKTNRTIDCYDYVDSFNYMNLHDRIKLYKHGFSKITDQLCREIRFNRIDRNSALKIAKRYEKRKSLYEKNFCEWLNIDQKSLNYLLDSFKNKNYWKQIDVTRWKFEGLSHLNKKVVVKKKNSKLRYIQNSKIKLDAKYIIYGKGVKDF